MPGELDEIGRSEDSGRTQLEVWATVHDLQTLASLITIGQAHSGELLPRPACQTGKVKIRFTFSDYGGYRDFHNIILSLRE